MYSVPFPVITTIMFAIITLNCAQLLPLLQVKDAYPSLMLAPSSCTKLVALSSLSHFSTCSVDCVSHAHYAEKVKQKQLKSNNNLPSTLIVQAVISIPSLNHCPFSSSQSRPSQQLTHIEREPGLHQPTERYEDNTSSKKQIESDRNSMGTSTSYT